MSFAAHGPRGGNAMTDKRMTHTAASIRKRNRGACTPVLAGALLISLILAVEQP
jgi:hypothetical protein